MSSASSASSASSVSSVLYCLLVPSRRLVVSCLVSRHGLQKILAAAASAGGHSAAVVRDGAEDLELLLEVLGQVHDGGDVAAAVAVVGGGPDGDDVLVLEVVLVALVDQLVGAGNQLQAVDVVELGRDLVAKEPAGARGDTAQVSTSSGSLQTRSQKAPSWGISWARATTRIWSRVRISGDRPPWTHRTLPSTMAARARKSKTWQQAFQTEALPYLVWHSS
ncbi:hypothetical protein OPT61_g9452 [Boeremia exigua]|uniref:Uncharacterized protein n=1 Tax=Boeremia exigua TaxID=749465 RepID=A0ACC2HUC2_9PLEO|nr:hypothetical protein OPT61_g9452 [Boeremia exigua]